MTAAAGLLVGTVAWVPMQASAAGSDGGLGGALTGVTNTVTGTVTGNPTPTSVPTPKPPQVKWVPPTGVVINNPLGGLKQRQLIITRIRDAIAHTRKGDTITFATYTFDRKDLANAMLRAHNRGVNVRMMVNDNFQTPQEFRLIDELGSDIKKPSFVKFCTGSCRARAGNLHLKVYAFSHTGGASDVVMSSSSNLTGAAPSHQWNDLVTTSGNHRFYKTWMRVFDELKRDRPVKKRRINYNSRDLNAAFHRLDTANGSDPGAMQVTARIRKKGSGDPVMAQLNRIRCKTGGKYGVNGRTSIRVAEYAWYGSRAYPLAGKIASLAKQGCNVMVITSHSDDKVVRILQSAGIPVRDATWWYGEKLSTNGHDIVYGPRQYSHLKVLAINGRYGKRNVRTVFTGSENWDNVSYINDEVTLQLTGDKTYYPYLQMFQHQWSTGATHPYGIKPTSPAPMENPKDAQPTAGPVVVPSADPDAN